MSETSYTPGTWFGIVGEHATVLLPPTEKARAGVIWALVDGGAGFEEVLDALVAEGLRGLPAFVLVAEAGESTRVVVRGQAKATFESAEGTVEVDGSSAATWAERSLRGVTRCSVDLEEGAGAPSYVVAAGLVRVGGIAVPPLQSAAPAGPVVAVPPVEYGDESPESLADEPIDIATPRRDDHVAPSLSLVPPVLPGQSGFEPDAPLLGGDPLTDPLPGAAGPWDQPEVPAEEDETQHIPLGGEMPAEEESPEESPEDAALGSASAAPGAPVMPPPPPFPGAPGAPGFPPPPPPPPGPGLAGGPISAPPPPPPPAFAPTGEHGAPARAGAPAAEPDHGVGGDAQPRPVARLEFSSGQRVDVDRVVVIGRAPEAGRFSHSEQPLLVTVPSPHQEISSTHLEVRPGTSVDHGAAVATDLGSTNGTVLVQPGMGPEELRPGVPVRLAPGAVIDLGDGLSIQVLHA